MPKFRVVWSFKPAHPKTRRHLNVLSFKRELFDRKRASQPLGQTRDMPHRDVGNHQNELIAAQPAANVRCARVFLQNRRKSLEHFVAGWVAILVVHCLEFVQISQDDPQWIPVPDCSPSCLTAYSSTARRLGKPVRKSVRAAASNNWFFSSISRCISMILRPVPTRATSSFSWNGLVR